MKLIFIYGPPAAGKTTVANELARLTGFTVFPNHQIIGMLSSLFPYDRHNLNEVRTQLSRRLRLQIYTTAAKAKVDFITTFGMAGADYFGFFNDIRLTVEAVGGAVYFVQLIADKHQLLLRVTEDGRKGQKIDSPQHLESLLESYPDLFAKYPDVEHLTIDNTTTTAEDAARIVLHAYNIELLRA